MENITKSSNIAVLAGGFSNEREVSLRSGKNVLNALSELGYKNAIMIDVQEDVADKLKENKIAMIGDESQMRLQDTMQKIVNDSTGGFICIII